MFRKGNNLKCSSGPNYLGSHISDRLSNTAREWREVNLGRVKLEATKTVETSFKPHTKWACGFPVFRSRVTCKTTVTILRCLVYVTKFWTNLVYLSSPIMILFCLYIIAWYWYVQMKPIPKSHLTNFTKWKFKQRNNVSSWEASKCNLLAWLCTHISNVLVWQLLLCGINSPYMKKKYRPLF